MERLTVGCIPYWNLLPLYRELAESDLSCDIKRGKSPSEVNRWLKDGVIDVSPCSSICLEESSFRVAAPIGIASSGKVESVYLGFNAAAAEIYDVFCKRHRLACEIFSHIATVVEVGNPRFARLFYREMDKEAAEIPNNLGLYLTPDSAASSALTKVLLRLWFKSGVVDRLLNRECLYDEDPAVSLLIGDQALERADSFFRKLDLGSIWHEMVGLPFVFAVWQSKRPLNEYWLKHLWGLADLAQINMSLHPERYFENSMGHRARKSLIEYWKLIDYQLHSEHFLSLDLFRSLYRELKSEKSQETQKIGFATPESTPRHP